MITKYVVWDSIKSDEYSIIISTDEEWALQIFLRCICSIVTKEQFSQMEYRIGE